ncbi:MAG: hypothetical protein QOE08_2365, partial [Thermoleophilaceae bacterium]|nr:hypothetical protein [Thermoleophilaceae bacterium]
MRLVTYDSPRGARAGVLRGDGVVDVWDALGADPPGGDAGLAALLATHGIEPARDADGPAIPLAEAPLLAPVGRPQKIVCIGLNYRSHAEETGLEPPASPTIFAKYRNALTPSGAEVKLPAASTKV